MSEPPHLPIGRLLVVGVVVPAIFVAIDHRLLSGVVHNPCDEFHIGLTMAAFVGQVAVMGVLCGRLLVNPWWRWGVYLWGWLLIDLQVFSALALTDLTSVDWRRTEFLLTASLLAAQVVLAIIWGILGSTHWTLRWPFCAVAGVLLSIPLINTWGLASEMFPAGVAGLVALCIALRARGFRLDLVEPQASEAVMASPKPQFLQFGVRHVLIWTTSLAIVLGVLRGLDLLHSNIFVLFLRGSIVALLTAGILVAALFIVAMWAALGAGPAWLRWPLLALATALVGLLCALLDYFDRGGTFAFFIRSSRVREMFWEDNGWIIAWMALAGGLLSASLLILRIIGYRLVRNVKPRPVVGVKSV